MAELDPIYKGALFGELPDSPEIETTAQGRTGTRRYSGTWEECRANEPAPGDTYVDLPGLVVAKTNLKYGSPYASLVVSLATPGGGNDDPGDDPLAGAIWYLDKTELLKPAREVPIYGPDGSQNLNAGDGDAYVAAYMAIYTKGPASDADQQAWQDSLDNLWTNMPDAAKHLITRLKRGQTTYPIAAPVVKAVIQSFNPPRTFKGYVRDTPNHPIVPPGYDWLYTGTIANFRTDLGIYEATHEWLGAEYWDEDWYPTGGPSL